MNIRIDDLDALDIGMIFDMMTESGNDGCEYAQVATQEDYDRF